MKSFGDISPWRCLGNSQVEMSSGQLHPQAWSLGLRSVPEVGIWGLPTRGQVCTIAPSQAQMRTQRIWGDSTECVRRYVLVAIGQNCESAVTVEEGGRWTDSGRTAGSVRFQ